MLLETNSFGLHSLDDFDRDGDGVLDFNEFAEAWSDMMYDEDPEEWAEAQSAWAQMAAV